MAINIGSKSVNNIYVGSKQVNKVYVGSKLVWPTKLTMEPTIEILGYNPGAYPDYPISITDIFNITSTVEYKSIDWDFEYDNSLIYDEYAIKFDPVKLNGDPNNIYPIADLKKTVEMDFVANCKYNWDANYNWLYIYKLDTQIQSDIRGAIILEIPDKSCIFQININWHGF